MEKLLIFGGTTEGRVLSECLSRAKISHTLSVATEYGKYCMQEGEFLDLRQGRKTAEEIHAWIEEEGFSILIDATHPYAVEVTENIRKATKDSACSYFRLLRRGDFNSAESAVRYFAGEQDCISALLETEGNVLLTTGSKTLRSYTEHPALRERIYARVLPGVESIKICEEAGIHGRQILAMQGPFTEEFNRAMLKQYGIRCMVSKESGNAGGLEEKLRAAEKEGVELFIIGRPKEVGGMELPELLKLLEERLHQRIRIMPELEITLCGAGMGSPDGMTGEVRDSIENADIVLGAERILKMASGLCKPSSEKRSIYQAEEIENYLMEKLASEYCRPKLRISILFSGDSGFFSGAVNVERRLCLAMQEGRIKGSLKVLPGISSVSAMAARLFVSWQDAGIYSIHGKKEEDYLPELVERIREREKSFLLLSGKKDLERLPALLKENGLGDIELFAGYQLSGKEERIFCFRGGKWDLFHKGDFPDKKYKNELEAESAGERRIEENGRTLLEEEIKIEETELFEGLYTAFIRNTHAEGRRLFYGLPDSDFERAKIPMTKEEVREIILSKLRLRENSVFYDIGGGSGSVSVEAARLSGRLKVFAIEKKPEAVALMKRNKEKFFASNMEIVEGEAPEALRELPVPSHAFIGGSSGNLVEILKLLYEKNPKMRVVISAVSLETIEKLTEIPKSFSVKQEELVQVQISRGEKLGNYHLLRAQNPVMIYSFCFR